MSHGVKWHEENVQKLKKLVDHCTNSELAEIFQTNKNAVATAMQRFGISRVIKNGRGKLSKDQRVKIAEEAKSNCHTRGSYSALARKYNLSREYIRQLASRQSL